MSISDSDIISDRASEQMRREFVGGLGAAQHIPLYTFKYRLKKSMEEGLLITIKYGLVLLLTYLGLMFGTNVVSGSQNGTNSALYLNQLIEKGYLPKAVNGQVPTKENENATLNTIK